MFLQSDCIFAMILMQEETLQEPSFSRTVTDMHLNRCLDPLRASIWDRFGYPKSIQNRSGGCLDEPWISDIDFGGLHYHGGRVDCTPEPRPPYSVIYILEFRARFARAQFSYLDVEARRPCWGVVRSRSGSPTPLLVIHFSTRVRVVIRSTLNISLNVWTQVFHVY